MARYLVIQEKKADDFFGSFYREYGYREALPLLYACSEKYINEVVIGQFFQDELDWPLRTLRMLYPRCPQLVIKYLERRASHLCKYTLFLPVLVKHHTQTFVELYECLCICAETHPQRFSRKSQIQYMLSRIGIRLGSKRANFFLKNGTEMLIEKQSLLLDMLPLKLVSKRLSKLQFETLFEKCLESDTDPEYEFEFINDMFRYYPERNKFSLLEEKYQSVFGKSILESKNHKLYELMFDLLPAEKKEEYGRKFLESFTDTDVYSSHFEYLPPRESIPMLKELISIISEEEQIDFMLKMIRSCSLYASKEDLLEVLRYLNIRHENECADMRLEMWQMLVTGSNVKMLDKEHWQFLKEIFQRAYADGDIFIEDDTCGRYKELFNSGLYCFLKLCKSGEAGDEDKQFLDKLVEIVLECCLEDRRQIDFMENCPSELQRDCLQKFLATVPQRYPEAHVVWRMSDNLLKFIPYLVKSIHSFNMKNPYTKETKKKRESKSGATITDCKIHGNQEKLMLRDYPWLVNLSVDMIKYSQDDVNDVHLEHMKILSRHDRELYQSIIIKESELMSDLNTFGVAHILKYEQDNVLDNWQLYLDACKEELGYKSKAAKNFVSAIKWYQELPIKFVEQCLLDIREEGSSLVLGILLEGDALVLLVQPYLSKDGDMDLEEEHCIPSLSKAIVFANPPVSLLVISDLCQRGYVEAAALIFSSVARCIPVNQILAFANQLRKYESITAKTLAIQSVIQVSSTWESRKCLERFWRNEKNPLARDSVARIIFQVFTKTPSIASYRLILVCIDGLTNDDKVLLEFASRINAVDYRFIFIFLEGYLERMREYMKKKLSNDTKSKIICALLEHMDADTYNRLQYFRRVSIVRILIYNTRLEKTMELLEKKFQDYGKPDPGRRKSYSLNKQICCILRIMFEEVFFQASGQNKEVFSKLINACITLLSSKLKPWQDMTSFIFASLAKDYVEAPTLKDFDAKLAVTTGRLVKEFGSDMVLNNIADLLADNFKQLDRSLEVAEGLTEIDVRLGAVIGTRMLDKHAAQYYDERYDGLIQKWASVKDPIVRGTLHDFQNDRHWRDLSLWH